jgi:hypothetical protein
MQKFPVWLPPNIPEARSRSFVELDRALSRENSGKGAETLLLIGFALMIPRAVWRSLGAGFDEGCFLGLDDLEWSLRARRAGFRLMVATDVLVYHRGQSSFSSLDSGRRYRFERESRNHLRSRLREWYGPTPPTGRELWGVSWFDTRRDDE